MKAGKRRTVLGFSCAVGVKERPYIYSAACTSTTNKSTRDHHRQPPPSPATRCCCWVVVVEVSWLCLFEMRSFASWLRAWHSDRAPTSRQITRERPNQHSRQTSSRSRQTCRDHLTHYKGGLPALAGLAGLSTPRAVLELVVI